MFGEVVAQVRWPVEWEALDDMQAFATRYARRRWGGELGERARLGACELLENAVRYATAGSSIELDLVDRLGAFEVRVTNVSVPSRQVLLRRHVESLAAEDAGAAYRRALRRLLVEPETEGTSRLGLLRLRHEAGLDIAVRVDGKRVTVIATGQRDTGRPARSIHGRVR